MAGVALLVGALLEDPAVQRRIQQDPELRGMWSDPAVRQHVTAPHGMTGGMTGGMTKVMELVRLLTEDPAVRARIQADPGLREMWSESAVRRQIQDGPRH
jgi:hypothetical protein